MEFLELPLYHPDIFKLLTFLVIDLLFLTAVVWGVYYRSLGSREYVFSYSLINVLVFFICITLREFELGLGMALGLFALFGILRYRTDTIPIKEMTYLFLVIGLAVINALANQKMSVAELAFTNGTIVGMAALLESFPFLRREIHQQVLYDNIDLVRPEHREALIADLQQRTGRKIKRLELRQLDFLRDTVAIDLFYDSREPDQ